MILNHLKLGQAANFMKYFDDIDSLIFLRKPLILNKVAFLASN